MSRHASKLFAVPSLQDRLLSILVSGTSSSTTEIEITDLGCGNAGYWPTVLTKLLSARPSAQISLTLVDVNLNFALENKLLASMSSPRVALNFVEQGVSEFLERSPSANTIEERQSRLSANYETRARFVVSFYLLEHLRKSDGWLALYSLDRFCHLEGADMSLIAVPTRFVYRAGAPDNSHNAHLSEWRPEDLRSANYRLLYGLDGSRLFKLRRLTESNSFVLRAFAGSVTKALVFLAPSLGLGGLYAKTGFPVPPGFNKA